MQQPVESIHSKDMDVLPKMNWCYKAGQNSFIFKKKNNNNI